MLYKQLSAKNARIVARSSEHRSLDLACSALLCMPIVSIVTSRKYRIHPHPVEKHLHLNLNCCTLSGLWLRFRTWTCPMVAPFPPPGVKVLTIGELTRALKGMLEETHSNVWVEGEVSNLSRPSSYGHQYLTLKDDEAPLKAVLYRAIALRMRFDLRDGMRVIARGRLTLYMPRGEYQLLIEEIQPKGIGPLELAFRQLKEKLSLKGYFDPKRKRKLPRVPRRIVLVTSPSGSAVRDMLEILSRRWPAAEVWICPVHVQGEGAAAEVAEAIGLLNRIAAPSPPTPLPRSGGEGSNASPLSPPGGRGVGGEGGRTVIDVLIVGRGGGSLEDLWTFNEECVARAIFHSRIPVVTGIGHEDDLTIADMVADLRALTPSEAAEKVVPDRAAVLDWLTGLESRFRADLRRRLDTARSRLVELARQPCFRRPLERIRQEQERLDDWNERMQRAMQRRVEQLHEQLKGQAARLESLSPLNVLARGYSLTRREEEVAMLHSAGQVRPGERVVTRLQHGEIISRVEETRGGE
jgi:exodeoxyribonuclease VII large subunit